MTEKRTVIGMLRNAAKQYPQSPYTAEKADSGYVTRSFSQVLADARQIASGLLNLGMEKNNTIAILSEGRSRWVSGEFGILMAGCISVPLSIKLLPEEILFRLEHSEAQAIMLSRNTVEKVASIWKKIKQKNFKIIYFDDDFSVFKDIVKRFKINIEKDVIPFSKFIAEGKQSLESNGEKLRQIESAVAEDDVVTISYTSGTTGNPKGIMLTHLNYYANSRDAMVFFDVKEKDRLMIILPLDHSFAHTVGIYASLVRGLSIYFVDSRGGGMAALKNIPGNLKEANPHFMLTVPALSGNFMNKIIDGVAAKGGFAKWLFDKGLEAGIEINRDGYHKAPLLTRLVKGIPYKLADMLVFKKIRGIFGTNIRYLVGGGALLDVKQQRFFYAIGVPVYQGYGLTEATPIISANTPAIHKLGSSGKVLPSVTCRIVKSDGSEAQKGEKGEIVIQGENVMKGYYKNPEATNSTIRDKWLFTGDMGYIDPDEFLIVVGREKALLISQDGEKYSPEEIEEAIVNSSSLIMQAMVYNDHKRYTTAVITLDRTKIEHYIRRHKIADPEILLKHIDNSFFKFKYESEYENKFPEKWIPSFFRIIEEPFTEQNKMINSTLKMVRFKITETYQKDIDEMYTNEGSKITRERNLEVLKKFLPFK